MNKVIGYGVSVGGIVLMAVGFGIVPLKFAFLEGVAANYISGAGIILIVVGVVLALKGTGGRRRVKHAKEEVPIYEGEGKNRKIVAYRKD